MRYLHNSEISVLKITSEYLNPFDLVWAAVQYSLVASLCTGGLLILISTELLCPKSCQQHPFHHLGYVLLRNVTFNFPPPDPNPANVHVLEMVHVSAL